MEAEVLDVLNGFIRDENGSRVTMRSIWADTNLDSFGTVVVFFDLDEKYNCFPEEWLVANITGETPISVIVERAINAC